MPLTVQRAATPGAGVFWAEYAWLGGARPTGSGGAAGDAGDAAGELIRGAVIEVTEGRFTAVRHGTPTPPSGATRLAGLTLPGLANAHSHAFHRALRSRTHAGAGTFWTWRDKMYQLAGRLDPDRYQELATATYAEMALAGITCVGEFHYLHHNVDGSLYNDPNEMGHRLLAAAAAAGIRITLLDTIYLSSTVEGAPLEGAQRRFGDTSFDGWARRVARLDPPAHARMGFAAHSVRAVPRQALRDLAGHARGRPVHLHLSEQRAENEACQAQHGLSPTQLLDSAGLLGPETTAVHATHLSDVDITVLGGSGTRVCLCPTTERDLADGIGPARALASAGVSLCLGSDSHAVVDLFEEARAVELDERLRDERRGHFGAGELLRAATAAGHASLGWPDAGAIEVGRRADLVTVALDSVRTSGFDPRDPAPAAVFAASAADVRHVVADGATIVQDGHHVMMEDVPAALARAVEAVWR